VSGVLILVPGIVMGLTDARRRATFAAVLYQVARETGARVLSPPSSPVGRNYDLALVELADGRHARFMLNAAVRVVGVAADDDPHRLDAPFLDVPRA
jgi:hypothetical protein